MAQRVDQILAGYCDGDAISREARGFRTVFREMGFDSDIYAPSENISEGMTGDALPLASYDDGEQNALLYHFSIGSEATVAFRRSKSRKMVRYHNITPAEFFDGFDDGLASRLRAGRGELEEILSLASIVLADSEYNAAEARAVGCPRVEVMELMADLAEVEPDQRKIDRYDDSLSNILFVGRIVPNKCVEELILAFKWINKVIDAKSRLILVGSEQSCPPYFAMLKMLADRLELDNVCFEGFLNESELVSCYYCADVFVNPSRHEGYGLPLIEAMKYDVPVVARASGGMIEAMGEAGVMFDDLDSAMLGELVAKVMWDNDLAGRVLASQEKRMDAIRARDLKSEWSRIL